MRTRDHDLRRNVHRGDAAEMCARVAWEGLREVIKLFGEPAR